MPKLTDTPLNYLVTTRISEYDYKRLVSKANYEEISIAVLLRKTVCRLLDEEHKL